MKQYFRDGLEQEDINDDHYRRWYHEDRKNIGSFWQLDHGGAFFKPSFKHGEGWQMIHRAGDHVVFQNPDGRARLERQHRVCHDSGFEGCMMLAHDLRPKLSYRYDIDLKCYVADEENGGAVIVGEYPNYFIVDQRVPVFIGRGFHFYLTEQPDIMHAAKMGLMGTVFTDALRPEKPKPALRLCQNCKTGVIALSAPKAQIYCSVACGHTFASPNVVKTSRYECQVCTNTFIREGSGNHHYCSPKCRDHARKVRRKAPVMKACEYCGKQFVKGGSGNHRFCTPECGHFSRMKKRIERNATRNERTSTCESCGTVFHYSAPGPAKRFCSDWCKTMKSALDRRK